MDVRIQFAAGGDINEVSDLDGRCETPAFATSQPGDSSNEQEMTTLRSHAGLLETEGTAATTAYEDMVNRVDDPDLNHCTSDPLVQDTAIVPPAEVGDLTVEAGCPDNDGSSLEKEKKSSAPKGPASLPVGIVKRIMKLDPDVRIISKDSLFLICEATKYFLESIVADSAKKAWSSKRKGVKIQDIAAVAKSSKYKDCLGRSVTQLVDKLTGREDEGDANSKASEKRKRNVKEGVSSDEKSKGPTKKAFDTTKNRSIVDFLKATA